MNPTRARRFLDGQRIFKADRQRLFHHYWDTIPRTDLHHAAMIVGIGIREYRLRMRRLQHFLQIGMEQTRCQAIALREMCRELMIAFRDSHHLQVRALLKLIEESERVSVRQSRQCDAQRRFFLLGRWLRLSAGIRVRARQHG